MTPAARSDLPAFQRTQLEFTAHIRDPQARPRPADVEERRMAIYRDVLYRNIEGFIANGFPVLRSLTPDDVWHRRVRRFFADHRCRTPYFARVVEEFLDWLANERGDHPDDPPFILELAHYEWVELDLEISEADRELPPVDHNGDLYDGVPVRSPLTRHLAYRYPVHRIGPDFQPREPDPQPSYLAVYRDRQDQVHFLEINATTYRLLELLQENPGWRGRDALSAIADELQHPRPELVLQHGRELLHDLRRRNILIGTRV